MEQPWGGVCVFISSTRFGTRIKLYYYIMDNVRIDDPMYEVRSRLGNRLGDLDREETMEKISTDADRIDDEVVADIIKDCREATREMKELISDQDEDGGMNPMANPMNNYFSPQEPIDEEAEERLKKFFRISSLQVAYDGYFAFKSIVMN